VGTKRDKINEKGQTAFGQEKSLDATSCHVEAYMSGRLDSNQRPPEPHSGGTGRESRKNRLFLNLQIPYFPHFTPRLPDFPQNPLSFLPFPTGGIWPVAPGLVAKRAASPGRFDTPGDVADASNTRTRTCAGVADHTDGRNACEPTSRSNAGPS